MLRSVLSRAALASLLLGASCAYRTPPSGPPPAPPDPVLIVRTSLAASSLAATLGAEVAEAADDGAACVALRSTAAALGTLARTLGADGFQGIPETRVSFGGCTYAPQPEPQAAEALGRGLALLAHAEEAADVLTVALDPCTRSRLWGALSWIRSALLPAVSQELTDPSGEIVIAGWEWPRCDP